MGIGEWLVVLGGLVLLVVAVVATKRGWLRDSDRPEDRLTTTQANDASRSRASSGGLPF
jgi:hypothetical protein